MNAPGVPFEVWILGAFDPVLILVAALLGWKADQFGKVFIAAIAALGLSVLAAWIVTSLGLPWVAPVSREAPTLFPVRAVAAFLWAAGAFLASRRGVPVGRAGLVAGVGGPGRRRARSEERGRVDTKRARRTAGPSPTQHAGAMSASSRMP